ncbi:ribonuclease H-like domain-containing protein [Tanacetum coccineum]
MFRVLWIMVCRYFSSSTTDLVTYSDTDWAGFPTTRRSTLGYCVFLGNNLLSWSAKRQLTLSRSSADAEYRGVANAVAETCWLRNLLRELHTPLSSATHIYCDNEHPFFCSEGALFGIQFHVYPSQGLESFLNISEDFLLRMTLYYQECFPQCYIVVYGFGWKLIKPKPGGPYQREVEHVAPSRHNPQFYLSCGLEDFKILLGNSKLRIRKVNGSVSSHSQGDMQLIAKGQAHLELSVHNTSEVPAYLIEDKK